MARIRIEQGIVEGSEMSGVYAFLGMPYAAAPIGERRWQSPQPPDAWKGVRDATHFGPACLQKGGASFDLRVQEQSEDCLFLNVWTSTLDSQARQPVMVWIHGGGNLGGAGSEDAFDGAHLARQGVTVVTFNYRLGVFGFLAHPGRSQFRCPRSGGSPVMGRQQHCRLWGRPTSCNDLRPIGRSRRCAHPALRSARSRAVPSRCPPKWRL